MTGVGLGPAAFDGSVHLLGLALCGALALRAGEAAAPSPPGGKSRVGDGQRGVDNEVSVLRTGSLATLAGVASRGGNQRGGARRRGGGRRRGAPRAARGPPGALDTSVAFGMPTVATIGQFPMYVFRGSRVPIARAEPPRRRHLRAMYRRSPATGTANARSPAVQEHRRSTGIVRAVSAGNLPATLLTSLVPGLVNPGFSMPSVARGPWSDPNPTARLVRPR